MKRPIITTLSAPPRRAASPKPTNVDDSGLALREHLNNAFSRFAADQLTPPRTIDSQHDPAWTLPPIDLAAPWHRRGDGEKSPQALVLQTRHFQSIRVVSSIREFCTLSYLECLARLRGKGDKVPGSLCQPVEKQGRYQLLRRELRCQKKRMDSDPCVFFSCTDGELSIETYGLAARAFLRSWKRMSPLNLVLHHASVADHHRLQLGVVIDKRPAKLAAHPRGLIAAEGHCWIEHRVHVHPHSTGLNGGHHAQGLAQVVGP